MTRTLDGKRFVIGANVGDSDAMLFSPSLPNQWVPLSEVGIGVWRVITVVSATTTQNRAISDYLVSDCCLPMAATHLLPRTLVSVFFLLAPHQIVSGSWS
jgi:hypothetical protein